MPGIAQQALCQTGWVGETATLLHALFPFLLRKAGAQ